MGVVRMLLALVGATVLLGALASMGSARNLSTSETRTTATFPGVEFTGGFGTVRCSFTAGGAFHQRTIAKVLETLSGLLTAASIGGCGVGSATILRETLPWHIRYAGFTGTLPSISTISAKIIGIAFQFREPLFGVTCLATSTAASPGVITMNREAVGRITSARMSGTLANNCGINGRLEGATNAITPAITVTLI
jgi:hypothetical protein